MYVFLYVFFTYIPTWMCIYILLMYIASMDIHDIHIYSYIRIPWMAVWFTVILFIYTYIYMYFEYTYIVSVDVHIYIFHEWQYGSQ